MCNEYIYYALAIIVVLFLLKQTQLGSRFSDRLLYTGASVNTIDDRAGHSYFSNRVLSQSASMDMSDDRPGHVYSGIAN